MGSLSSAEAPFKECYVSCSALMITPTTKCNHLSSGNTSIRTMPTARQGRCHLRSFLSGGSRNLSLQLPCHGPSVDVSPGHCSRQHIHLEALRKRSRSLHHVGRPCSSSWSAKVSLYMLNAHTCNRSIMPLIHSLKVMPSLVSLFHSPQTYIGVRCVFVKLYVSSLAIFGAYNCLLATY